MIMNRDEIKKLIVNSLSAEFDSEKSPDELEKAGVKYSFREGFRDKVIDSIFNSTVSLRREIEFSRSMNSVFYRIALSGVAAIVILLISIFLKEGSLSLNSFLGLSESYDESIVYLLTGI